MVNVSLVVQTPTTTHLSSTMNIKVMSKSAQNAPSNAILVMVSSENIIAIPAVLATTCKMVAASKHAHMKLK